MDHFTALEDFFYFFHRFTQPIATHENKWLVKIDGVD